MKPVLCVLIFSLLISVLPQQVISQRQDGFEVGLTGRYLFSSPKEHDCLAIPDILDVNQFILSSPVIYQSISQELGGEFLEVSSYDDYSSSRTPSPGIFAGYLFDNGWRVRSGAGWTVGTLSRGFSGNYYNIETELPEYVSGTFDTKWTGIDLRLGGGYQTPLGVPVNVEAGALLNFKYFSAVDARIAGTSFEVSGARNDFFPGFYFTSGVQLWPEALVSLEVMIHLDNWFKEGSMVINPGLGLAVVWHSKRESQPIPRPPFLGTEISEPIPDDLPKLYSPARFTPLFTGETSGKTTVDKMNTQEQNRVFEVSELQSLVFEPGEEVRVPVLSTANFIIYPEIMLTGTWDTLTSEVRPYMLMAEPYIAFEVPETAEIGYYDVEITCRDVNDELFVQIIPVIVRDDDSEWVAGMTGQDREFFLSLTPEIDRWRDRAKGIRNRLDSLRDARDSTAWKAIQDSLRWQELVALDRRLDLLPEYYKRDVDDILDSLDRLESDYPGITDPPGLLKKVEEAEDEVKDCHDHTAALEKELEENENRCEELKSKQDAILERIHQLFTENGFTGTYGYNENGRYRYGYSGLSKNTNTDYGNLPWEKEVRELKKQMKSLNGEYMKCLERSRKLPEMIAENQGRCEETERALEKAREDQARGEVYVALESDLKEECEWAKMALRKLKEWCDANPGICTLGDKLDKLLEQNCPRTREEWNIFWNDVKGLLKDKMVIEDDLKRGSKAGWDRVDNIEDEITDAEKEEKDAWDAIRILQDEAARSIREAKAAARRDAAAARAAEQEKRRKVTDCLEKLEAWFLENQDMIDPSDRDKIMSRILSGGGAAGQGAMEAAEQVVKGATNAGATLTGVGVGAFHLAAAILYMVVEDKLEVAANKVVNDHIRNRIEAEAILSNDPCGVVNVGGDRTYFYMKVDNKTLIFAITPSGFDFYGVY